MLAAYQPRLPTRRPRRLANAAAYGRSGRIGSLPDAIALLGRRTVGAVLTAAAVTSRFRTARCPGFDLPAFWRTSVASGIAAQLVRDPRAPGVRGDVDLVVVLRNTTDRPQEMAYDSWPLATQSACTLEIVDLATRQPVAARDVPIPKPDIEKYFSRHARRFKISLAPGEAYTLHLPRVTTAHPGWGYKEELGFSYYPISKPGPHTVTALCRNLFGKDSVIRTGALELPL